MELPRQQGGALRSYDTDRDGVADYFTYADPHGRIERIAYDLDGDGQGDQTIRLDAIPSNQSRHFVIILDGVGFDLLKDLYDRGALRVFYPPSRVIAPYPTMTDVCIEDIFGYVPCPSFEAMYYDRKANRLVGGSGAYLRGENQPYNRLLHYRANLIWDALGYLAPWSVFGKEINDAKRLFDKFDKARTQESLAYFVSSAGVGTSQGAEGHRKCLVRTEQLINQLLMETDGAAKFTLLSDHGHTYTPAERTPIERHLTNAGWRLRNSLRGPKDVVYIRFGLVSYASFASQRPAELAADLITCEGVELASYADDSSVVVLGRAGGRGVIRRKDGRFSYEPTAGDPLKLEGLLHKLGADEGGYYDAAELLRATVGHEYPAPLQRIWRAHLALVENPPDVIVSLGDAYYSGSTSFAAQVKVASTHGGLNYKNSTAFIMSTIGPLPEVLRSADVPAAMSKLLGRPWPLGK